MGRIRTIKPEFPQSESMGKISRDARLLFIQMWTLADDSGRLRGNSRMLASLLYPYDNDVPDLIDKWMSELVSEKCIVCYLGNDGAHYVSICRWKDHQKIDKPTVSKLPDPNSCTPLEPSREVANPRESSSTDLGSRKGPGEDLEGDQDQEGTECATGEESPIAPPPVSIPKAHQEVATAWNQAMEQECRITRKRSVALKQRLSNSHWVENWRAAIVRASESDFCRGVNDRGWVADLEWFLKPDTVTKLLEGKYDNRERQGPITSGQAKQKATDNAFNEVFGEVFGNGR